MPSFSLRRFLRRRGVSASATAPSTLTMPYSTINRGARAQSEPLPSPDEDVEMGPPIPRSRSEPSLPLSGDVVMQHETSDTQHITPITKNVIEDILAEESEDESQSQPRAPSPAPTEVHDPDPQDITIDILRRGIKIRDFAYVNQTPSTSASQSSDPLAPVVTTTVVPFKPAIEIFDQYKGLAEVEFRWTQKTRIYPIAGKTLRRLLDMRWIEQKEVDARAHPMDLEDLRQHDARPIYPWRPFRWTSIPCLANRADMAKARSGMFNQLDRIRASSESAEQKRRIEQAQAEVMLARYEELMQLQRQQIERARIAQENRRAAALAAKEAQQAGSSSQTSPGRNKRRLEPVDDDDENTTEDETDSGSPKKRRLTPHATPTQSAFFESSSQSESQPSSQSRYLCPPDKQYPAPLHTYDPQFYPEAASIIESSSQTASQPRPVVPQRTDTPPLSEDEGGSASQPDQRRGTRLVHPRERKAMKRALSRTQTFAQLIV